MKHKLKNRIMCLFAALWLILSPMLSVLPVRADDVTMPSGTEYVETTGTEETSKVTGTGENDASVTGEATTGENETAGPVEFIGAVGAAGVIENAGVNVQEEPNFCVQSIEVYPEGEDSDKLIVLEGLMPEDATAEAVDVTEERDGKVIAAYDITIKDDGGEEFQPDEENPINVEISDERISEESESLELWHILDDGTRIQITEFTVEDGKICFEAVGFSIYEIVEGAIDHVDTYLSALAKQGENGFYAALYFGEKSYNTAGPYYYKGGEKVFTDQGNRKGLYVTELSSNEVPSSAVKLYFEKGGTAEGQFYIYEKDGDTKKYLKSRTGNFNKQGRSAVEYAESEADRSLFTLYTENGRIRINCGEYYWVADNGSNIQSIVGFKKSNDANLCWMELVDYTIDPLGLNNKSYGLMSYSGGTHGYAFMADSSNNVHSLIELVTHQMKDNNGNQIDGITLFVDEGSEVTKWKFHSVDLDHYALSANVGETEKYLAIQGDALVLVDNADAAAGFVINVDASKKIQLCYQNEKYVSFYHNDNGTSVETGFELTSTNNANTWLNLIDFAKLSDDNLIVYSADRISVSRENLNGEKVIVYTRIWNEQTLRYDIYAVDYNGTLFPCYASGGKILWLGDSTGSLEWEFTEYYDSVTKEPNYYYELFNPYSEKYLAPQMNGNQVLSDNPIGINMQGRRNGEFYSDIVAWDNTRYAFIGLKPNEDKTKLVPCSQSNSVTFYFATLEDLNLSGELHPVETLDNKDYGISMRMIDYKDKNALEGIIGNVDFFATTGTKGILSTDLKDNGYPQIVFNNKNRPLSDLFGSTAMDVNHLFIKSIYNSSGYFEFDSCQNFATLCDENGNLKTPNGTDPIDFTVYRELGTSEKESKNTLKHGQFLPFNFIRANEYSVTNNPLNTYSAFATAVNNENNTDGALAEDDPRKYEKLYKVQGKNNNGTVNNNPNYQNGLELSASFVQTVSGLDAWGHDIIFEFTGDDDFWLYVDGELVIDLGGNHSALGGSVNFRTGEVIVDGYTDSNMTIRTLRQIFESNYKKRNPGATQAQVDEYLAEYFNEGEDIFKDYSKHTMRVFYMERGGGASNLHMKFNLASVTPGHVVVSKNVEGEGAALLDKEFLEYPFQIYYTLPEDETGQPGKDEILLANDDEHIRVTYQNSNQPVTFVQSYRPPGFTEEQAYKNIYFINPTKNAEIAFPDNTISYRIVECAVDKTVYPTVKINGEIVPEDRITKQGDLISYSSTVGSAENKPSISFDNYVGDNVVKELFITKKLLDENNQEITNDPTTFDFRLYLSSVDINADDMQRANMAKYYVLSPDKKICWFNPASRTFEETPLQYSRENIEKLDKGEVPGIEYDEYTFRTSGFGAISGIPAGYTIVVPGLPVGAVFKVTEDIKSGYGLDGYECIMGEKIDSQGQSSAIPSYLPYDGNPLNVGKVIVDENPQMEVHNKKGYGLTVKKKWSDLDLTTGHDTVYVAVYVDGVLLEGSVREIKSPSTSTYYFWPTLLGNRTDLDDYEVKEVKLTGSNPTVANDGTVTGYETLTPLNSGVEIHLTATRTKQATPDGEFADKEYAYVVSYQEGTFDGSTRTDTVSNTRKGGIAIRLFKWDSTEPLKGGIFTLKDATGTTIGTYESDAEGIVTMLYEFDRNELYTLTETSAPEGYVGLQKKCRFRVNNDDTVSLYYEDGATEWGTGSDENVKDTKWLNAKPGENGIDAFIDVYNKQFNFIIEKSDKYISTNMLESAHFALYKQVNTTIGGYMKSKDPMTGFEDFETDANGVVYVCGGNSGRVIRPGSGAVYFLTETQAPVGYTKLDEDIVFRISALGVPTLISDPSLGQLVETENSYVFTLSVPNEKSNDGFTITKTVAGNMGNKAKDFTFTFEVINPPSGSTDTEFTWKKNGIAQATPLKSGNQFTLGHKDNVIINVPDGTEVRITEVIPESEGYTTTFKVNGDPLETVTSKQFVVDSSTVLSVVNERTVLIPTGVFLPVSGLIAVAVIVLSGVIATIINRRRYEEEL